MEDYTAVGASGAVSGIIASSILLYPFSEIGFIIIPGGIASWMFGLLLIVISIFGIKAQSDNIGHEAHLGGIMTGILLTLVLEPGTVLENWWILLALMAPIMIFLYLIYARPDILITNRWNFRTPTLKNRNSKKQSVDDILDKIRVMGIESLTTEERDILKRYSQKE